MPRRTFRQDVVARLKASSVVTALCPAANVYDSRTTRIPVGTMPAIVVFAARTRRRKESALSFPQYKATHSISIDCFAVGATDAELGENLDLLAEAVVDELLTDGDFVAQFEELGDVSEEVVLEAEADNRHGLVRITIEGSISECYEPKAIDDLSTVHVDVDVDGDGVESDPDDLQVTVTDLET